MIKALRTTIILMAILFVMLFILGGIVITMVCGHWGYAIGEIFIILFFAALFD
jgi:hypothetical protein